MLRRMEKRVAKLERRAAKLERENKALRAGQAALIEAMGQMLYHVDGTALLPDGLRFVSASWDGTARIAYHGLAPQ